MVKILLGLWFGEFPNYEKAIECHNSKEYQEGWNLAKDTTQRNMQIVEGFSIE